MTTKTQNPVWPTIKNLKELFVELKTIIGDDYRASDYECSIPTMMVTIGADGSGRDSWSYQTGDNSYSGGAYHYPHWAVITLNRRSNSTELARDAIRQLDELWPNW